MSDCNGRYLCADGRIQTCPGHGLSDQSTDEHGHVGFLTWRSDDPCAWYATFDGAGVDEKVPWHLVGVGSQVANTDGDVYPVIYAGRDHWVILTGPHGGLSRSWQEQRVKQSEIGRSWHVIRAVPPAHTGTNDV